MKRTLLQRQSHLRRKLQLERSAKLARTKPKKLKKIPKPISIDDELKDLCRQIVLIREGFQCVRCHKGITGTDGVRTVLQVHHIRTVGAHPSLKYELLNLILVCRGCHMFFFHGRDSYEAVQWYKDHLGENRLESLAMMISVRKGQRVDKQAMKLYLAAELAKLSEHTAPDPQPMRTPAPR